jgi:outer membrane protein
MQACLFNIITICFNSIFFLAMWHVPVLAEEMQQTVTDNKLAREHPASRLPLWEAGLVAAGVNQSAYPGAEDRASLSFVLPFAIYRGNYFRIDRDTVGLRAIKTPRVELDVGFAASLGSRASDIEARRGMDDLGLLVEFGPRLKINLGEVSEGKGNSRIQIPLRGVYDLNDHLKFRGTAYELQWVKEMELSDDWLVTTNLGALFADQQLADTYYRVAPGEATTLRPAYNASSGLISWQASIFSSRFITRDMRLLSYLRFNSVVGSANHDSPLVRRDTGWTFTLGLLWTLSHSAAYARE